MQDHDVMKPWPAWTLHHGNMSGARIIVCLETQCGNDLNGSGMCAPLSAPDFAGLTTLAAGKASSFFIACFSCRGAH